MDIIVFADGLYHVVEIKYDFNFAVMDFFDQKRQQRKKDQDVTLGKRGLSSPTDAQVTRTIPHSTLQLNR